MPRISLLLAVACSALVGCNSRSSLPTNRGQESEPINSQVVARLRRTQCGNNLSQIALALRNYAEVWNALPPAYTVDADGNPLHSWRTLILPYLEEKRLYETIELSKAWNDPANLEAHNRGIAVYRCLGADYPDTHTTYMAIVASDSCFRPNEPRSISEITGNPSETLMIIEVNSERSVHWMSPQDADEELVLNFGPNSKLPHKDGVHGAFLDGRVRIISSETPAADLLNWISISAKGH